MVQQQVTSFFEPEIEWTSRREIHYDTTTGEYVGFITKQNGSDGTEIFRGKLKSDGSFVVYNKEGVTYTLIPETES